MLLLVLSAANNVEVKVGLYGIRLWSIMRKVMLNDLQSDWWWLFTSQCWCCRNIWLAHAGGKAFDVKCQEMKEMEENRGGRWAKRSLSLQLMMEEPWIGIKCSIFLIASTYFLFPCSSPTCWIAGPVVQQNGSIAGSVIKDSSLKFHSSLPLLPRFASILTILSPSTARVRQPAFVNSIT